MEEIAYENEIRITGRAVREGSNEPGPNRLAIYDGHRNFEPWSSEEDDTRAGIPLSSLPPCANVRTLNWDILTVQQLLCMDGLQWKLDFQPCFDNADHKLCVHDH
ncbi:hypothetical protein TNCV_52721 [Trichonephila clavipes]|nr:hypothetical protein TNCV_52721 [Trichonephila clavipes]